MTTTRNAPRNLAILKHGGFLEKIRSSYGVDAHEGGFVKTPRGIVGEIVAGSDGGQVIVRIGNSQLYFHPLDLEYIPTTANPT